MPVPGRTSSLAGGWRDRAGFCGVDTLDQPPGTLDLTQRLHLQAMTARTRLSHDLIAAFADRYGAFPVQLVAAQTRELIALRLLLARYGLIDLNAPLGRGGFADPETSRDYDRLLAQGSASRAAALDAVARVLRESSAVLEPVLLELTPPDVRNVYFQLYAATWRQRRLVQAWTGR
jgi:hypothetical protein